MSEPAAPRPFGLLIAALGGEGGGVLTQWIVAAATASDLPVQSTSIPGVAQRTGATTYYLEIYPRKASGLGDDWPVMGLYPSPGGVDLMVASELLEAARALENGFVTPGVTTLVASTHRVYSIAERSAMGDGAYDGTAALATIERFADRRVVGDFAAIASREGAALNAVLLGLIAGTGLLPIEESGFSEAIESSGIAVASNLKGFRAGLAYARGATSVPGTVTAVPASSETPSAPDALPESIRERLAGMFPTPLHERIAQGVTRLIDYQDVAYAERYLERLETVISADDPSRGFALTLEAARQLALWMSYEDVIRVGHLKARGTRFEGLRREVRAGADEPVRVTEFFKPGIEEISAIAPARLGRWMRERPWLGKLRFRMRVKSHTVTGFLKLLLLARLKPWRPRSLRFQEEQVLIERWLNAVRGGAGFEYELGLEIVACAGLNKGYGDTFERGRGHFLAILSQMLEPALVEGDVSGLTARLGRARARAASDPAAPRFAA